MINDVVDNYIKPYDPRYKKYDNKNTNNWILNLETTTELSTIYILQDSNLIEPIINRKEFLEKKLDQIKQLKDKIGISEIPRENTILAYLVGHFIFEQKDKNDAIRKISEDINKSIEDVLRLYIKGELNK